VQLAVPVGMNGDLLQVGFGATDAGLLRRTLGA
jgi:hypothetical protein